MPVPRQTRHVSSPMPGASAGPSSPAFGGVAGSAGADRFVIDMTGSFRVFTLWRRASRVPVRRHARRRIDRTIIAAARQDHGQSSYNIGQ